MGSFEEPPRQMLERTAENLTHPKYEFEGGAVVSLAHNIVIREIRFWNSVE